ncbi:tetratricopeptide repeat protein [Chryseobacterium sp. PBS4-4]|uniref:Tetratricopeptide repeat protein n=1 Tax=Chryseobacterium edaphi TaxID=2976532 RepID=A0ABT2W9G9_9FLAO|nr:tetratricopeptide repeat protein [Chryseobacterium edaphi]MCU7618850.1 tetratricopeptide repeat protein [Chryseobacterium edaphi]
MNIKFYFLVLVAFFLKTNAQLYAPDTIDSLITKASKLTDKSKSIFIISEIYNQSDKINYGKGKMRSLFYLISDYNYIGNEKKALELSNKLLEVAKKEKNYLYEVRALIKLANIYANSNFYNKTEETIEKALSASKNLEGDDYYTAVANIYRCKSIFEELKNNLTKQLIYDKIALQYCLKINSEKVRQNELVTQYTNLASSYSDLEKSDSAIYYSRHAVTISKKINTPVTEANALFGMARTYYSANKNDSAIYYYKKVLPLVIKLKNPNKLLIIYENMSFMYEELGDTKNFMIYNTKALEQFNSNQVNKKKLIDSVSNQILLDKQKEQDAKVYIIISGFAILIIIIIFFSVKLMIRYKKIKELKRITEIGLIEKYEKQLQEKLEIRNSEKEITTVSNISDEKENELLKKLNNFEKKEQYLSQEISLSSISATFNTNVNYLSKIIKKHKDNNFNGYINELRINYITQKLRTNPEYLNYKIAYLAEECGFSSYSYFVNIFKQQTGLTPSKFIDYLKKETMV